MDSREELEFVSETEFREELEFVSETEFREELEFASEMDSLEELELTSVMDSQEELERASEMDSLVTTLAAMADVAEEWRQANRGPPRENDRLVVVQRRRVGRPSRYTRPGRFRLVDPQLIGVPFSEEGGDPNEVRVLLAPEGAGAVHEIRVLPFQVSRDSSTTILDEVTEFPNLRDDMVSYEARYPAAVEVRNNLGEEIWDGLEEYRCGVAYLAFSTLLQQNADPIDFPLGLRAALDHFVPHMENYIAARWGEDDWCLFLYFHESLEDCIDHGEDGDAGIEFHQGGVMRVPKVWFRRQPLFWLVYNLHFPVEGRMSWEQVSMWAIRWLGRTNMEAPAWPTQLRGLHVWNPDATTIWNEAVLEVFADIRRRFSSTIVP